MSERPTPETDALHCDLHNSKVLQDRYSTMLEHSRQLERDRDHFKWELHMALDEIEEARKMERAWLEAAK